jgi:Enoyl-CoA hydratase/carnithine racemase
MTTFEHVISSHRDRNVIQIAIQRPDKRNALASAHWAALEAALDEAAVSDAHILVLSGVPGAFCAGADIDELAGCWLRRRPSPTTMHWYSAPSSSCSASSRPPSR